MTEAAERKIEHYVLRSRLGVGGMGEVWLAIDSKLARPVALKILSGTLSLDEELRARFLREAQAASGLNHPNIVTVFETGEYESQLFLVMEYIEGTTLRTQLRKGLFTKEKTLDIMKQTLTGLTAAHQANIIHRDLKPENLMLRSDGYIKILDFGLAKILDTPDQTNATKGIIGTPRYMSPEQATGKPLDARSDVFSIGVVFYELLTGKIPFSGANLHEILSAIIGPQMPPFLEGDLKELTPLIFKAINKDKRMRYANAGEMLKDLLAYTSGSFETAFTPVDDKPSLIVLPFHCAEEDRELCYGICEEIIDRVSRIRNIRVMSRSISQKYRDSVPDIQDIGKELNVKLALTGSLRRKGEKTKIIVQLEDIRTSFQVWGERFQFQIQDFFDAEEEISDTVVNSLRSYFTQDETEIIDKKLEGIKIEAASTAREHYLNGIYLYNSMRVDDVIRAVEHFKKSIETYPNFPTAHAKLSSAYLFLYMVKGTDDLLQSGIREAEKALELDKNDPDAFVSLGLSKLITYNYLEARRYLMKALSIAPNNADGLSWFAYLNIWAGDSDHATLLARKAVARDPQTGKHYIWLAYALISQGRYMEASDALDRAIRLDARNPYPYALLLFTKIAMDRPEEARMIYDYLAAYTMEQPTTFLVKKLYEQRTGIKEVQFSSEELQIIEDDPESCRIAANIFALKGDKEKTYELLELSIKKGYHNLPLLDTDPVLRQLHREERFRSLRSELVAIIDNASKLLMANDTESLNDS